MSEHVGLVRQLTTRRLQRLNPFVNKETLSLSQQWLTEGWMTRLSRNEFHKGYVSGGTANILLLFAYHLNMSPRA